MKFNKRIIDLSNKIKDEANYYRAAAPKVAKAVGKRLIGEKADNELQQFRKEQCESCPLFTGSNCNKNMVASYKGDTLPLLVAQKAGLVSKDSFGNTRTITIDNETYYRGCGCSLTGVTAKWKFDFEEEELNMKDGTAPCPMGKWSTENFNKWKNESTK